MIVHSTRNDLDGSCVVHIEGIEPSDSEQRVKAFAAGAAARHNAGFRSSAQRLVWCDERGREVDDSTTSTVALVTCRVVAP